MPPRTRSRRRATKDAPRETKPVKSGANHKLVSKPTPKAPLGKKARKDCVLPEEEAENQPVLRFAQLPLELFLEIATHLYPLDLIHLSRTAKIFRSIFMRRRVADVWRTTLTNVGLPLCPDNSIPEPRYAALIYLERCSECYKPTTHYMDPILLVRLCHACRKHLALDAKAVGSLANVLTHSQYLLPLRGKSRQISYLLHEYEDIKEMARELEGGDRDVWYGWKEGRKCFVQTRHERAKPLIEWLIIREEEQRQANNELKNARAAQIQARLLELGWEIADIRDAGKYSNEWTPLVYRAEPLNDEDWKNILPSLMSGLNRAWKERLRMELRQSRQTRKRVVEDWLLLLSDELRPTNLTFRWREPGNRESVGTSCASLYPQGVRKQNITIRIPSIPPSRDLMEHCPNLRNLLHCNIPMEEFRKAQSDLREQYSGWRASLEAALVKTLPNDLKPTETQNTDFDLQPMDQPNSTSAMNPGDRLSPDLRVLLRADVRFKCYNGTYYYPTGFDSLTTASSSSTYDVASSSAAKAILGTLQRPNASYLEMRALGQSFLCVRCIDEPKYYTWDDIVTHYVCEYETWSKVQSLNQLHARRGKGITLLPTHNLDEADQKPLVRLVATEDQVFRSNSPQSECKLCLHIGHCYQKGTTYLVRHVREVHSVEKPVLEEHYAEVLPS